MWPEVFFAFPEEVSSSILLPRWLFNDRLGSDCCWKNLPYKVALPTALPLELCDYCCVLEQTGPEQDIVHAALKSGIFLTREQLHSLWQVERFLLPAPKQGSGKTGGLIKKDYVVAALKHYFKGLDESSEEFQRMFNAAMGSTHKAACPEDVLAAVAALDPISKEDFASMKQAAENQRDSQGQSSKKKRKQTDTNNDKEAEDDERDGTATQPPKPAESAPAPPSPTHSRNAESSSPRRAPGSASGLPQSERKRYTPGELHTLIPGRGSMVGVYIKRSPGGPMGKCYQGFYPTTDASGSLARIFTSTQQE